MPDPQGLRRFAVQVQAPPPERDGDPYAWRLTITRGELVEYESPWEPLLATAGEAAQAEARERAVLVMVMVQGGHVERLEP